MGKSHSVNVSFEEKDYRALRELADAQDRTINGQARHMLRDSLRDYQASVEPLNRKSGIPETGHSDGAAGNSPQDALNKQEPLPG